MDLEKATPSCISEILKKHKPQPEGKHKSHSVMVLLFEINGELHMLFNKRAATLKRQPNEVCFPGGRAEDNEEPLETAYREVFEELGISKNDIEFLGQPDYIITHYGNIIIPFVGYVKNIDINDIKFSTDEVAEIFTVPIKFFRDTKPISSYLSLTPQPEENFPMEMIPNGKEYKFSAGKVSEIFYEYNNYIIWGMTARIARNVCKIIEREC